MPQTSADRRSSDDSQSAACFSGPQTHIGGIFPPNTQAFPTDHPNPSHPPLETAQLPATAFRSQV